MILTTIGMSIQLWTLYTCVLTNILGLSLALRGPEGSVDRAVRHMAEQNQLVMNRFGKQRSSRNRWNVVSVARWVTRFVVFSCRPCGVLQ